MNKSSYRKHEKIDWNYCFICQRKNKKDLTSNEDTLQKLAENIQKIWEAGKLDLDWYAIAKVSSSDNNDYDLCESLKQHGAKFHHKCSSKYNKQKVERCENANKPRSAEPMSPVTRSLVEKKTFASTYCAICSKPDNLENLHAAGSLHASKKSVNVEHSKELTTKWKMMALKVGNESLLNRLSSGDVTANELYYHGNCNTLLRNECKRIDHENLEDKNNWKKAEAFNNVVNYIIENERDHPGTVYVVKELNNLYIKNLTAYGIQEQTQTTRFSERLVAYIPNLCSQIIDRKSVVLFDEKIHQLVSDYVVCPDDFFASLRKVVHPIRSAMNEKVNKFTASFNSSSQIDSVPRTLLLLTSALIDGNNFDVNTHSQEALTAAQIIMTHVRSPKKKKSTMNTDNKTKVHRHLKSKETPLTQYVGLTIYSMTRSRDLIDRFYRVGLCVSYDRILEITKLLYENLQDSYSKHGCFFPRALKKGLFSVWLKDNVDVNPKSNFSKSSYHGTSSSMIQFTTIDDTGIDFLNNDLSSDKVCSATKQDRSSNRSKKLMPLPSEYTNVENLYPTRSNASKLWAPLCETFVDLTDFSTLESAANEELSWLETFNSMTNCNTQDDLLLPTGWASYHASKIEGCKDPPGINTILPLLRDKVHTLNTQAHLMAMNIKWTGILNPGQTPVDVSDQPVYALTKELQYRFPDKFSKYFALFGQLHIEQSILVVHGQLISGSGIPEILIQNNFSTIGLSAAVDVNNIKRARYCLQITLCALYTKLCEAASQDATDLSPYEWLCKKSSESKVFSFWKMVMDLEIHILIYVRSIREGIFKLYVQVLRKLLKWYFIFDRYNYARWLTIHWFDLNNLKDNFPDVFEYFCSGFFSFQKSDRKFSRMGLDQIHEQNNAVIKGAGGAVDLVNKNDDSALIRWETCGPDIARLVHEFENNTENTITPGNTSRKHHEDNDTFQKRFSQDVNILCKALVTNPFQQTKLAKLNNEDLVVPDSSLEIVESLQSNGENQVLSFINDRLVSQKTSICETIVKNRYDIWNVTKETKNIKFTPKNAQLNKMRSSCEHRSEMGKMVFKYEILDIPQSLSSDGFSLYHGSKSDIVKRLPCQHPSIPNNECKSALVLDMSAIIKAKAYSSNDAECFSDFAVIIYYEIMRLGSNFDRIDVVFDRYFEKSLKGETRRDRGIGSRYPIEGDGTPIPNNMTESFLKNNENKNELNEYLAKKIINLHQSTQILIATWKNTVLCSHVEPLNQSEVCITKCQSEEADQRIVRHALHCIDSYAQYERLVIRTIDTDVLILVISYVSQISEIPTNLEIYVYMINSNMYFDIKGIIDSLGWKVCHALPFFHAFTGCDTVSSFHGKGKRKAWDTWLQSEQAESLTTVFTALGNKPSEISTGQIDIIELFVRRMYSHPNESLGNMRFQLFLMSSENDLRKLPPSRDALENHVKRAAYQAGYLWRESLADFELPNPSSWGWTTDDNNDFVPLWLDLNSPVDLDLFLTTCSCKSKKCKNCKCTRNDLSCVSMCACNRQCSSL